MKVLKLTGTLRATQAIVMTMRQALVTGEPLDVQSVERHKGRFDTPEELERFANKSAGVLVAAMQTGNHETRHGHTADVSLVAFIVCRAQAKDMDAAMMCEHIASKVTQLVRRERWNITNTAQAKDIKANNLYSAALDGLGVSIWAVSWTQNMSMEDESLAELDEFMRLAQTNDIADGAPTLDACIELEGAVNENRNT